MNLQHANTTDTDQAVTELKELTPRIQAINAAIGRYQWMRDQSQAELAKLSETAISLFGTDDCEQIEAQQAAIDAENMAAVKKVREEVESMEALLAELESVLKG